MRSIKSEVVPSPPPTLPDNTIFRGKLETLTFHTIMNTTIIFIITLKRFSSHITMFQQKQQGKVENVFFF